MPTPKIVKKLTNLAFRKGDSALIQFIATGTPDTEVKWFRNGEQIQESDNYSFTYDFLSGLCALTIRSAELDDSGQYSCIVSNCSGSEQSSSWVVVRGKFTSK